MEPVIHKARDVTFKTRTELCCKDWVHNDHLLGTPITWIIPKRTEGQGGPDTTRHRDIPGDMWIDPTWSILMNSQIITKNGEFMMPWNITPHRQSSTCTSFTGYGIAEIVQHNVLQILRMKSTAVRLLTYLLLVPHTCVSESGEYCFR